MKITRLTLPFVATALLAAVSSQAQPAGRGGGGGGVPNATPAQQTAITAMDQAVMTAATAEAAARQALTAASLLDPRSNSEIQSKADALRAAEQTLATSRATEFNKIQSGADKLSAEQVQTLIAQGARGGGGGGGGRGGAPAPGPGAGAAGGGRGGRGGGPALSAEETAAIQSITGGLTVEAEAITVATSNLVVASFATPKDDAKISAANNALADARQAWSKKALDLFTKTQATTNKLSDAAIAQLTAAAPGGAPAAGGGGRAGRGGGGGRGGAGGAGAGAGGAGAPGVTAPGQ